MGDHEQNEDGQSQASRLLTAAHGAGEAIARIERLQRLTAALASASTAAECAAALSTAGRAALQAQAAFVWLVDPRGEMLELAASDGYLGPDLEPFRAILVAGDLPVCDALRGGQPIFLESPGDRRQRYPAAGDGARAGFQSWAAIPFLQQGRPVGALSVSFDQQRTFHAEERALIVTMAGLAAQAIERTRLFDAEVLARKEVEQANRAKDEFLAMLGHELRNPLSPIFTALQLMRLRGGDVMLKERTIIERQVKHMARLVDDLLDVSRVARGKVSLSRAPIELSQVMAKALETVSPALEERSHQLSVSVPPLGLVVDADEQRLAQVFANLLTNAAKFTQPGGRIQILAEARQGRVRVEVRDNGVGIDPQQLPRVFDLFTQARPGRDPARGGLGIGLSVVRNLLALHGGTVTAHSDGPGCGSEFVVELPLAAPRSDAPPEAAALAPRPREDGRRVLIVDDNRDAADSLSEALAASGHLTAVAYDGPSALQAGLTFEPQIAFLDIGLPVMDGYELARRLRAQSPDLALVALTGYGLESDRNLAQAAGFQHHLVKPIDLDTVDALIAGLRAG
jgi:signal transduction histidine kinase